MSITEKGGAGFHKSADLEVQTCWVVDKQGVALHDAHLRVCTSRSALMETAAVEGAWLRHSGRHEVSDDVNCSKPAINM